MNIGKILYILFLAFLNFRSFLCATNHFTVLSVGHNKNLRSIFSSYIKRLSYFLSRLRTYKKQSCDFPFVQL